MLSIDMDAGSEGGWEEWDSKAKNAKAQSKTDM